MDAEGTAKSKERRVRRGGRESRFLAQSVVLEESGGSRLIRATLLSLGVMITAGLIWAAITRMEEVAVTAGEVIPSGRVQVIQHLEGGILQDILVREGDLVAKGQPLLRLDPTATVSELNQYRARLVGLRLNAARLSAFGREVQPNFQAPPGFEALVADQQAIFDIQESARRSRREVIERQIAQRREELAILERRGHTLEEQLNLLTQELKIREESVNKGVSSPMGLLNTRREVNQARGDLANLLGELRKTTQTLAEFEVRLAELNATLRENALNEMGTVNRELVQVEETMSKFEDRARRLDLVAPTRGIVKGLKVHTVGGVIPPRETLLEVVPMGEELVAEVRISTTDIGHVRVGQPVMVKLNTYDFARYGGIASTLIKVSATTFVEGQEPPFYKGLVKLSQQHVGANPQRNLVIPGMTIKADIGTGEKTLLQYLLKPVYSSVNEAFRER